MRIAKLGGMVRGWFVGAFEPTLFHTSEVEVAVQRHAAGTEEAAHFHRIATEITGLVSGLAEVNGVRVGPDDAIILAPGEVSAFRAVEDTVTVVVKLPGALDDKYLVDAVGAPGPEGGPT